MTSERADAYGRVVVTLSDMGPAKLLAHEQELIREAADALFFCEDLDDGGAAPRRALADVRGLAEHLVETGRWLRPRAERLVDDVAACGPAVAVAS